MSKLFLQSRIVLSVLLVAVTTTRAAVDSVDQKSDFQALEKRVHDLVGFYNSLDQRAKNRSDLLSQVVDQATCVVAKAFGSGNAKNCSTGISPELTQDFIDYVTHNDINFKDSDGSYPFARAVLVSQMTQLQQLSDVRALNIGFLAAAVTQGKWGKCSGATQPAAYCTSHYFDVLVSQAKQWLIDNNQYILGIEATEAAADLCRAFGGKNCTAPQTSTKAPVNPLDASRESVTTVLQDTWQLDTSFLKNKSMSLADLLNQTTDMIGNEGLGWDKPIHHMTDEAFDDAYKFVHRLFQIPQELSTASVATSRVSSAYFSSSAMQGVKTASTVSSGVATQGKLDASQAIMAIKRERQKSKKMEI